MDGYADGEEWKKEFEKLFNLETNKQKTRKNIFSKNFFWRFYIYKYDSSEHIGEPYSIYALFSDEILIPAINITGKQNIDFIEGIGNKIPKILYLSKKNSRNVSIGIHVRKIRERNIYNIVSIGDLILDNQPINFILDLNHEHIFIDTIPETYSKIVEEVTNFNQNTDESSIQINERLLFWSIIIEISKSELTKKVKTFISKKPIVYKKDDKHIIIKLEGFSGNISEKLVYKYKNRGSKDLTITYGMNKDKLIIGSVEEDIYNGDFIEKIYVEEVIYINGSSRSPSVKSISSPKLIRSKSLSVSVEKREIFDDEITTPISLSEIGFIKSSLMVVQRIPSTSLDASKNNLLYSLSRSAPSSPPFNILQINHSKSDDTT